MEKSKQMIEEKEEEDRSTDFESTQAGTPFDFNEVSKNMVTSLVFKNSDISIYHAYSNQKQYTIVAYISAIPISHSFFSTSRTKIKIRRTKQITKHHDSLNSIQQFYEELKDLQTKNLGYTKNMMQILHIKRDILSQTRQFLANDSTYAANIGSNNTFIHKQSSKFNYEDEEEEQHKFFHSCGRQQGQFENAEGEGLKASNKRKIFEDREVLLVFFESYERSIEEDIAERSLNQNNILYEEHILESYSDMIDCFQLLGNSIMQHVIVNSDYLVICREKLTKILPIYNLESIIETQPYTIRKVKATSTPDQIHCKLNSSLKNKHSIQTNPSSINNILSEPNDQCRTRSKTKLLLTQQLSSASSQQSSLYSVQKKQQVEKIMTRSATLKQQLRLDQKKDLDSYTSSTMEVEMVDSQNEHEDKEFEDLGEEDHIEIIEKRGKQQMKEKDKFMNNIEEETFDKQQEDDQYIDHEEELDQDYDEKEEEIDEECDEVEEEIDEENVNAEDDEDEDDDDNDDEIVEEKDIYSGYSKSSSCGQKIFSHSRWNQNKIFQTQNKINISIRNEKQNGSRNGCVQSISTTKEEDNFNNTEQNHLTEVERKVLEELSIIYLRLSAFLTSLKFNPQKRNKEMRILQIIKSLIEYKISSLFTDIFADSCFTMTHFNLTYQSLKEMVNSYRQQKVIVDIAENTDLSNIIAQLTDKTDIVINYKDKSLLKLEELESILCQSSQNFSQKHTSENDSFTRHIYNQTHSFSSKQSSSDKHQQNSLCGQEKQFSNMDMESNNQKQPLFVKDASSMYQNDWFSQITSFEFKADLCRLGDEGTLMISNILERIPPLQLKHLILSLRRNSISEQGIFGISRYVEKCKYLQTFRIFFSYNRIRDAGLTSILRSIVTLEQLQVLDLRFFDNQITAEGCQGFQDLQDVNFKDIKYLNMSLGNNQIGDEGCRLLSLFLCNIRNVKQLSIFLESNQINSNGIAHLKNVFVRKNQIKYLILHALSNKIEDDGIIKILDNIAKLTTLHSLEIILNENSLTEKAGVALGQTIKNMVNLTSLILSVRNNKISNKGVNSIGNNLKNLKNLESLVLSLTNNNIQGDGGVLIGKNLKYLTKLQKLHLVFYENSINHKSGKAIGEGLSNLKDLNYLILGIGDNNVGDEGAVAIGNCMLNLTKVKIFEIYLQNNEVGSNGASAIAKGLTNMRNLKCLVFQIQHSDLGDNPMIELGKSLQNLKQLKSLDIYVERCNIGEDGGFALGKGLYHLQNLKVMVLDLDSNSIGPRGGKALGDAFANMYGLIDLKLYLKKNNMMLEGGQGLFEGIQHLRKLKSLNIDLYKNYTGDNSIITCGRALTLLKDLRNLELSITYNAITQIGAQQFSEYFGQCISLQEVYLYMQKNNITPQGAEYIGNALSSLRDLQQLKISFGNNRIENQGISNLIKGVSNCESLRVLYLYAYNIGMTGEGCISIAQHLKKMKKLERFEFFPSANSQINLKNGLAQIAQSVIENHETLQNVRVDIPYWDEKIKAFIKPRINNQIQTMQTILFNRLASNHMIYNPKAIHWDLFIE